MPTKPACGLSFAGLHCLFVQMLQFARYRSLKHVFYLFTYVKQTSPLVETKEFKEKKTQNLPP